ncbi:MAG TPA: DedA family protein [Gammaproteobacteria bacterium]|jgi:membrane protein DedA with SNARE-associated domain|nr:DedA family protein [Gammaproteobacteria bacterium]
MIGKLLAAIAAFITGTLSTLGYAGVVLLMGIESACIPLPSELIMPFAGYLVFQGKLSLWGVALAGAMGCVLGSLVAYYVGLLGGRPLVVKYGRYLFISPQDIEMGDRWFARYGEAIIFVGRLLPVVRTFIAFPAGVARMHLGKFVAYTFVGSLIWCWGLAWIGRALGEHWDTLGAWFHRFDAVIGALIVLAAAWWIRRHFKHLKAGRGQA